MALIHFKTPHSTQDVVRFTLNLPRVPVANGVFSIFAVNIVHILSSMNLKCYITSSFCSFVAGLNQYVSHSCSLLLVQLHIICLIRPNKKAYAK